MVRHVIPRQPPTWKALLAVSVAAGALLWHLLACKESPMAFSPDGKNLAFVTCEPYDDKEPLLAGIHAYRLMVLEEGRRLRIVETTTDHMLTAPAYSPDGKQICYLRLPLLSDEGLAGLKEGFEQHKKILEKAADCTWGKEPASKPTSSPTTRSSPLPEADDLAMPSLESVVATASGFLTLPDVPAVLMVRDAGSDAIVSTRSIELPILSEVKDYRMTYITTRPQFSPDGKWVHLCAGSVVIAIDLSGGNPQILAAGPWVSSLSPDGKTVAVLQTEPRSAVGLVQTDGQAAWYRRLPEDRDISLSGLAWTDDRTLAVLQQRSGDAGPVIHLVRPDGTIRKSVVIALPEGIKTNGDNAGELAVAPNGDHMVISWASDVVFLAADGKLRKHWHSDQEEMVQPAFRPDSKAVAFKCMTQEQDKSERASAIAFFSPDGRELARVPIPRIPAGTTQPAKKGAG